MILLEVMMNATRGLRASTIAVLLALTPASVFAADMAVRRAPPPGAPLMPIPIYNWTGFYAGGSLGGAFESTTFNDSMFGGVSGNRSGFIGGGQVGYNWQFAPWGVIGVEWAFDGTSLNSTNSAADLAGNTFTGTEKVDWVTTVTGRFGFAANNWLFYGKGGGGWVHDSASASITPAGAPAPTDFFSASQTRSGWAAGAGIEYGITQNWIVRVDWTHLGLDDQTMFGGFTGDFTNLSRHLDIVTAGFNFKF